MRNLQTAALAREPVGPAGSGRSPRGSTLVPDPPAASAEALRQIAYYRGRRGSRPVGRTELLPLFFCASMDGRYLCRAAGWKGSIAVAGRRLSCRPCVSLSACFWKRVCLRVGTGPAPGERQMRTGEPGCGWQTVSLGEGAPREPGRERTAPRKSGPYGPGVCRSRDQTPEERYGDQRSSGQTRTSRSPARDGQERCCLV